MKIRILVIAGAYALGLFLGGFMTAAYHNYQEPYCPEEDSCTVDYYDGKWHIEEATP